MKTAIIIHHSLTADGATVSWDAIRTYHTSWRYRGQIITEKTAAELKSKGIRGVEKPWSEIGYHCGVERVGLLYRVMRGRPLDAVAAAVREGDMNKLGIHVCLVGNFDVTPVPDAQWLMAVDLVAQIARDKKILVDRIFGHRDFAPYKSCPGLLFDLNSFREDVAAAISRTP